MSVPAEHDAHSSFIKTPKQLVIVILLSFLVPIIGIILLVQLVVSRPSADPAALTPESVAARIQPVGRVEFGAAGSAASAQPQTASASATKPAAVDGKQVYDGVCTACHTTGVANAPKLGDKAAWAPRIATGTNALLQSVTQGKGAMPPKGGDASLSEPQLRAAVEFILSQSK